MRTISESLLCLCVLVTLSGCSKNFNVHKWVAEYGGDGNPKPKFSETDHQRRLAEQRKSEEEIKAAYRAKMKDTDPDAAIGKNDAAKQAQPVPTMGELDNVMKQFLLQETIRMIQCQGTNHGAGSLAWEYCGR